VGAAPLPQPPVLHSPRILLGDAFGVAHNKGADLVPDGEGDGLLGGLMLGVVDAAAMPRLGTPNPDSMTTPAARAALLCFGRRLAALAWRAC
jgi:hypothetical protein